MPQAAQVLRSLCTPAIWRSSWGTSISACCRLGRLQHHRWRCETVRTKWVPWPSLLRSRVRGSRRSNQRLALWWLLPFSAYQARCWTFHPSSGEQCQVEGSFWRGFADSSGSRQWSARQSRRQAIFKWTQGRQVSSFCPDLRARAPKSTCRSMLWSLRLARIEGFAWTNWSNIGRSRHWRTCDCFDWDRRLRAWSPLEAS